MFCSLHGLWQKQLSAVRLRISSGLKLISIISLMGVLKKLISVRWLFSVSTNSVFIEWLERFVYCHSFAEYIV